LESIASLSLAGLDVALLALGRAGRPGRVRKGTSALRGAGYFSLASFESTRAGQRPAPQRTEYRFADDLGAVYRFAV